MLNQNNEEDMWSKIVELSIANTKEINNLRQKDSEIVDVIEKNNQLTNDLITVFTSIKNEINDIKKFKTKTEISIDEINTKIDKSNALATAAIKVTKGIDGYCNQREFGSKYMVKIGSKSVGKLLKVVGIAMKQAKGKTIPYDNMCPCYAKILIHPDIYGYDHPSYVWNYNKCSTKIDEWLKQHDLYEQFYSNTTSEKMERYISYLHNTFVVSGN
jgi:hypothetical protein